MGRGIALVLLLLPAPAQQQDFVAADDLEVHLFAQEPQLVYPTSIDVDEKGRVWVAEGANYRQAGGPRSPTPPYFPKPDRKTGDRIVVLEDTDGDGVCDSSRVFAEGLDINMPLGIAVIGDKVWISQSPHLSTIEINPDGTAGRKEHVLSGFGAIHGDHGVHSVYVGPEGKLYGCFGDYALADIKFPDGRTLSPRGPYKGGCAWRANLDLSSVEILGHNYRNPYECATDSFGATFMSDNDDDDGNQYCRMTYVLEGGNFGYQPVPPKGEDWNLEKPGVVPLLMRFGAGAPAGLCVYEGTLLPERYRGMPILAEPGTGRVLCFRLAVDGAGYRAAGAPEGPQTVETLREIRQPDVMLSSKDRWFRPSDVAVAPDGSLFVADFYNKVAGGRDLGKPLLGRIYRIVPKGHGRKYVVPPVDLVGALGSPCLATRTRALLKIRQLGAEAVPVLAKHANSRDRVLGARVLQALGPEGPSVVRDALRDPDADFRALAVHVLRRNGGAVDARALSRDPSPRVRREALLSRPEAEGFVDLALGYDGRDRIYLEAVGLAAQGREATLVPALLDRLQGRTDPAALGLLWRFRPPQALPLLVSVAKDGSKDVRSRGLAMEAVAEMEGIDAGRALLGLITPDLPVTSLRAAFRSLQRKTKGPWKELVGTPEHLEAMRRLEAAGFAPPAKPRDPAPKAVAAGGDRLDPRKLPPERDLLQRPGDAARGREAFLRSSCATCHSVRREGGRVEGTGPDLSAIAAKMGKDGLLASILRPSESMAPGWASWILRKRDGDTLSGLVVEEGEGRLALRTPSGETHRLASSDIEARRPSDLSFMPEGLVAEFTVQGLADLLEFLSSQK